MSLENKPEEWRDVVGFESLYEVSSTGRIRRSASSRPGKNAPPGRLMEPHLDRGYPRTTLSVGGVILKRILVHRAVAEAFLTRHSGAHVVNHKNGIKSDNRVDNLEWVTPSGNTRHAWRLGLCQPMHGSRSGKAKLNEASVALIRARLAAGERLVPIAADYGVTPTTISYIRNYKTWLHLTKSA